MSSLAERQVHQPASPQRNQPTPNTQKNYKSGVTKGEKLIYSLFLTVIVFGLYLIISNYASIYLTNYEIQQNDAIIQDQLSVNEGLQLQVMELSDPERILSEAKKMGMILNEESVKFTHLN